MKYKLRSSSKNAADSKSTYHSSSRSSSSGNTGGPPEKRARLEHGVGRSGGSGVSLRRKPWVTSLISVETQTDTQDNILKLDSVESQPAEDSDKRVQCLKICDICGAAKKKRRLPKIEDDIGESINAIVAKSLEPKPSTSDNIPPEDKDISSRLTNLSAAIKFNGETKLTICSLPLEVSKANIKY